MEATMEEVSSVFRLVREVCDLWDDPGVWRERLLSGACKLLNGHVGMMLADHAPEEGWFGNMTVMSMVGLSARLRPLVQPCISEVDQRQIEDVAENLMPAMKKLQNDVGRQGWATIALSQVCDQATYHASPWYLNFRKQIDCDDNVVSIRIVDLPRRPEIISIDRPHGAPAFAEREVTLMKLLHDEIAPLVGVRLTTEEHLSRSGLSKRLRETLSLLLEGQSEKQAAIALNLATRTVHDYVTRLYDHFRVSSRAELLAYFVRRTNNEIAGNRFVHPTGMVAEHRAGNTNLIVADPYGGSDGRGAISRISLANGSAQRLCDNETSHGALEHPRAIISDESSGGQCWIVLEPTGGRDHMGAILRINNFGTGFAPCCARASGIWQLSLWLQFANDADLVHDSDRFGGKGRKKLAMRIQGSSDASELTRSGFWATSAGTRATTMRPPRHYIDRLYYCS